MKRPWNIIDSPVYSLATYHNGTVNMNICTYVTAVSMTPKRYAIAVYHNTKTLSNIQQSDTAVLQFLQNDQYKLVNVLGKKSGNKYDKQSYLTKKNILTTWNENIILQGLAAQVQLQKISWQNAGDHDLYLFDAVKYKTNENACPLMFQELINLKIILG